MTIRRADDFTRDALASPFARRIRVAARVGLAAAVVVFVAVGAYSWDSSGSSMSQLLGVDQAVAFWFSSRQAITPLVGLIAFLIALRALPVDTARPPVRSSAIGEAATRPELRPRFALLSLLLSVLVVVALAAASLSSDVGQGPELVVTFGTTTSTVASSGWVFAGLVVLATATSAIMLRRTITWAAYAPASGRMALATADDAARHRLMKIIEVTGQAAAATAVGITLWSAGGGFASAAATPASGACDSPSPAGASSVCHEALRYIYVQPVYGIAVTIGIVGAIVCLAGLATIVRTTRTKSLDIRASTRTEHALDHRR